MTSITGFFFSKCQYKRVKYKGYANSETGFYERVFQTFTDVYGNRQEVEFIFKSTEWNQQKIYHNCVYSYLVKHLTKNKLKQCFIFTWLYTSPTGHSYIKSKAGKVRSKFEFTNLEIYYYTSCFFSHSWNYFTKRK